MLCSYLSVANLFDICTCIVIEVRVDGKHPVGQLSYHSGAHHIPTTFTAWITYSASVSIHILTVHISVSLTQCIMCILPCSIAPIAKPTPPSFVARAEGKLLLPFVAPLVTKRKGRLPGTGHVFQQRARTSDKFDLRHLADPTIGYEASANEDRSSKNMQILTLVLKALPMKITLPGICR